MRWLVASAANVLSTASEMTYIVSSGALNSTHSLTAVDNRGSRWQMTDCSIIRTVYLVD